MRTRHFISVLAIGATILAGSVIAAPASTPAAKPAQNAESRSELPPARISEKLTAAGYRDISKIEREHDAYEVKAVDRNGARVKLYVDPQTGNVLENRAKGHDAQRDSHDDKR